MKDTPHVLFVCLGNICRSPCAQAIFHDLLQKAELTDKIHSDSCATGSLNIGKSADPRILKPLGKRARFLRMHKSRQICDQDFACSTHIAAMDWSNLDTTRAWAPPDWSGEIRLLEEYNPHRTSASGQIPDPYYCEASAFETMAVRVEQACNGLLQYICSEYQLPHP